MPKHYAYWLAFLVLLAPCVASGQPDYRIEKYNARNGLQHHWVSGVDRDGAGFIWVSLLEGTLARFDGTTFRHFPMNEAERQQFGGNQISRFIIEDGKKFLLLINMKPARFDPATGRFSPIEGEMPPVLFRKYAWHIGNSGEWKMADPTHLLRKRDGATFELPEKIGINDIFDTGTEIWVAAFEGLFKITPRRRLFETPFSQSFDIRQGPPTALSIYGIVEAGGWLWFHGLGALMRTPIAAPGAPETIYERSTLGGKGQLVAGRDGEVWSGRHSMAFVRFRPAEKCLIQGFAAPKDFKSREIISYLDLPDGKTWVATGDGILEFEPEKWSAGPPDQSIVNASGHGIHEYKTPADRWIVRDSIRAAWQFWPENGTGPSIWAATDNGLVRLSPKKDGSGHEITGHFRRGKTPGFGASKLLSIHEKDGILWLGSDGGLVRFSLKNEITRTFTTADGLPNNKVYYALPDGEYLWCGTDFGLARIKIASVLTDEGLPDIRTFHVEDGLPHEEFNTLSFFKSPTTGKIYLGGLNGMTVFSPRDLETAAPPSPPLVFTEFEKYDDGRDTTVVFSLENVENQTVALGPHDRFFTIRFALLSYQNPAQNRYQFRLDGFEKKWNAISHDNHARYANLPPGEYTFRVRAADHNGNWNPKELSLRLVVGQVWYKSWWAWLLYFLAASGVVFAVYRERLRRARLAANLKIEQAKAQHLEELDSFKSRLFANISHEFRTPLTVILGNVEFLKNETGEAGRTKLDSIRRNGQGLLRLVNQILDLAKLEDKSLKINHLQGNVAAFLRYSAESLHSLANAQNVQIRVETPPEIIIDYDPERLGQVLQNLLSNAIKFTPGGGRIDLKAAIETGEKPVLKISVTDPGVGISPDDLPQVFDRFFQAKNQSQNKAGGTGIGLSLTRELVVLMGGEIGVESQVGNGTTFTVRLPMTNDAPLEKIENQAVTLPSLPLLASSQTTFSAVRVIGEDASNGNMPRLLIVEDNPDVVDYLRACLSKNFRLDHAFNGRAGIEIALETVPDIILSDVMMPEKDGFEVCDSLKNDERTSHVPIVLLTAKADVESRIAGLRRGADAYLAKPFHPEELAVTLEKLLENRRRLQAHFLNAEFGMRNAESVNSEIRNPDSEIEIEHEFLKKLREAIEPQLGEAGLAADEIARKVGMSRSVLYAKLAALTGLSFNIYLRKLRLKRAQELLKNADLQVSEVAYEVGFNDPRYFMRVFSEEFGLPPGEWRKQV